MLRVNTQDRYQLIDITSQVEEEVEGDGAVVISLPHSTAGILITEDEEGLKRDWLKIFRSLVEGFSFDHDKIDNNADSHILSGLVGQSKVLPVENDQLVRGTWQQIFLAEFDGPRERKILVKMI